MKKQGIFGKMIMFILVFSFGYMIGNELGYHRNEAVMNSVIDMNKKDPFMDCVKPLAEFMIKEDFCHKQYTIMQYDEYKACSAAENHIFFNRSKICGWKRGFFHE